jgi:LPXTG-motif cell wall-anchored protein
VSASQRDGRTSDRAGHRLRRAALVPVLALLALLYAVPAAAYPVHEGTLTVPSGSVAPGKAVTLTGGGYTPGGTVSIDVFSSPVHLKSVTADGAGAISASVTIPTGLSAGSHSLRATGTAPDGSTVVLSVAFTVRSSSLAQTGSATLTVVTLGSVVLMLGVALIVFSNRRRGTGRRVADPAGA